MHTASRVYPSNNGGKMTRPLIIVVGLIVFMIGFGAATLVFAQSAPYFQGKTIMLIQGREPGGT